MVPRIRNKISSYNRTRIIMWFLQLFGPGRPRSAISLVLSSFQVLLALSSIPAASSSSSYIKRSRYARLAERLSPSVTYETWSQQASKILLVRLTSGFILKRN